MHPEEIEDLMDIADVGRLVRLTSTGIEPRRRDALLCHTR